MKRIDVVYVFEDEANIVDHGYMFDNSTVLLTHGLMWHWLTFSRPISLTSADELLVTSESDYVSHETPAANVNPARLNEISVVEYMTLINSRQLVNA